MDDILIKPTLKKYANPKEFDTPTGVTIQNFEELTTQQVTERDGRAPLFPPKDGVVYRLTFTQEGVERHLDVNSPRFRDDLSRYAIKKGEVGTLQRVVNARGYKEWRFTR